MANKDNHRRFGNVRKRESGRYQIRYPGPDGRTRTGTETYERKSDAERALSLIEAQIIKGEWNDPERGKPGSLSALACVLGRSMSIAGCSRSTSRPISATSR